MTAQGWYPDPSGRFTQRWFDGIDWTDHVVGANGQTIQDPLPGPSSGPGPGPGDRAEEAESPPPPTVAPPPSARATDATGTAPPPPPRYPAPGAAQSGGYAPRPAGVRFGPGPGLALDLLGVLLVVLSLFVLKWADTSRGGFADIHTSASHAPSHLEGPDALVKAYATFAAYVFLGLAVVGGLLVGIGVSARNAALQVVVAVVAGVACVYHAFFVERLFRGPGSPLIGAWLGVVGYLVLIAGLALGARRLAARVGA